MSALPQKADIVRPPRLRPHQMRDRPERAVIHVGARPERQHTKGYEFFLYRPANVVRA